MARDRSNGWEAAATNFIEYSLRSRIGVDVVRDWASALPNSAAVLDLGCGPGTPRTAAVAEAGVVLYAVDAAPTLAAEYARRFPQAHVAVEAVEDSRFFDRKFDAVLAWGLLFLLPEDVQRRLIRRVAQALNPGGRFLFTAPREACSWTDASTGRTSISLGAEEYKAVSAGAGLHLVAEHDDEGDNHYYDTLMTA